jgi:DNA-binding LacI/PurR family transcriptional regulator
VLLRGFSIASLRAGYDIGRFLLNRGHRKIAFVSADHGTQWSVERLRGTENAFAAAGFGDGVVRYARTVVPSKQDIDAIDIKGECDTIDDLITDIRLKSVRFSRSLKTIDIFNLTVSMRREEAVYGIIGPWFDEISADRTITALVAATDELGIMALDHYAHKGISIPGRMAVIGFDDTPLAHDYSLSSYNFNFAGIARTALTYILNPRHEMFRESTIECDGIIMERRSTAGKW